MENLINLPIVGKIQHGEQQKVNNKTKVVELKHFIAKVKDEELKGFEERFSKIYPKQNKIEVRFISEDPFSIKQARYNMQGLVCYCMDGEKNGKEKVSGKWQEINCDSNCKYRQLDEKTNKPQCMQEGILKFMIPKVSSDRIWIMRIKSYYSIQALKNYIEFQKQIGNSLKGDFVIYLTEKTQTNKKTGKSFKNQILNIVKKEDFNIKVEKVNSNTKSDESNNNKETTNKKVVSRTSKKASKENSKEDSAKEPSKDLNKETNTDNTPNLKDLYAYVDSQTKSILKDGKPTDYLFATLGDVEGNIIDVMIPPEETDNLLRHEMGTEIRAKVKQTKNGIYYIEKIEYVTEYFKQNEVAA